MDISKLVEEKVQLQITLQAMSAWNTYGQKFDDLVAAEKKRIETVKRMNDVQAMIDKYTEASCYQNPFTQ